MKSIPRARVIAMAVAAALMAVMVLPEIGYVPIWDGRVYANCVIEAAFGGISMESLRCAGHPSQGWALALTIPQLFSPGSVALIHLTNLALGIGAVIAFRVVLARAVPDESKAAELDLVAIAAAVHPVLLSTLVQPNVDWGVYVFFFIALAGLLTPGRNGTLVALIGGTFLVFSKETGVAAYGLAVAAALAIEHTASGKSWRDRIPEVVRRGALLGLPVVLFVAHVAVYNSTHDSNAIWKHTWQKSTADAFNFFDLSEPIALSYFAGIFILGFMWVAWLPVAADAAIGIARVFTRKGLRPVTGCAHPTIAALTVMTAALTYLLTSFRTWSNLRYFALLYPLFLLLTYSALLRLGVKDAARRWILLAIVAFFLVSDRRSVDPLSAAVYGTFDAGDKRMYRMASITGEFDGPGRDQLVYNLEFTGYHHLQNAFFQTLHPGPETVIGTPRTVRWNVWSQLDAATFTRTMRRDAIMTPVYADEIDIAARKSREAWFLDFTNRGDRDHALDALRVNYSESDSVIVRAAGHRMVAHHLVRREAAVVP